VGKLTQLDIDEAIAGTGGEVSNGGSSGDGVVNGKYILAFATVLTTALLIGWVNRLESRGEALESVKRDQAVLAQRVDAIEKTSTDTNQRVIGMQAILERRERIDADERDRLARGKR
jgi:hypothetical protein